MSYPIRNNIGAFPTWLWEDETRIIDAVITAAFDSGYQISVEDEEEVVQGFTSDRALIQKQVAATETTIFRFKNTRTGNHVGAMIFIHGNRADVISDHTDNAAMKGITMLIEPLLEMLGNN